VPEQPALSLARPPAAQPVVLADLLAQLAALADAGEALQVTIRRGGVTVSLEVQLDAAAPPPEPFVCTVFQESILQALEGKALRTDALGAAVGDRSRLYKPGGIKELRDAGLVGHHPRLGFYSMTAPPAELAGDHDRR
jgi:hypothetical protein